VYDDGSFRHKEESEVLELNEVSIMEICMRSQPVFSVHLEGKQYGAKTT
jgi:hypothetical protein